jgi:hypothetical protein
MTKILTLNEYIFRCGSLLAASCLVFCFQASRASGIKPKPRPVFGAFLSTLFLMLTNPITIAVFTALFAGELLEAF